MERAQATEAAAATATRELCWYSRGGAGLDFFDFFDLTVVCALADFNTVGTVEDSQLGTLDHESSTTDGGSSVVDVVVPEDLPPSTPAVVFALFGSLWRLPGGDENKMRETRGKKRG